MKNVIAYSLLTAFIICAYISPVWVVIWTIAFFCFAPIATEIVDTLLPVDGNYLYAPPAPRMSDYYDAFAPISDDAIEQEEEEQEDVWQPLTSCELACTIVRQHHYQLCLPAGIDIEDATLISSEYSYRALQAEVKALRGESKAIKLTAKKQVLIEWLQANA